MDKFIVPLSTTEQTKPIIRRERWVRSRVELEGKLKARYRHQISGVLMQSYSQKTGLFSHSYLIGGEQCPIQDIHHGLANMTPHSFGKQGISALEFDKKGIYLAIVTKSGCLTVLDFETLYCQVNFKCSSGLKRDVSMHLLHIPRHEELDVVRWNLANQDEVACSSMNSKNMLIFDIGYISSEPVETLSKRRTLSGFNVEKGFSDIAFSSNSDSRVFASDSSGIVSVWDRRKSKLPCLEFSTDSSSHLNRIQVVEENQIIFGACKSGFIYIWDLRGGKSSTVFQSQKEACYSPLASLKLATELEKVGSLKLPHNKIHVYHRYSAGEKNSPPESNAGNSYPKVTHLPYASTAQAQSPKISWNIYSERAQANIVPKEIHSVDINPSCPNQLAFHLDDGWSGVLDIHNFSVTHVHCPPPPWLEGENENTYISCLRKPSWVSTYSMYAVGSAHSKGLYLLDFYPDLSSPCHIDYNEDIERCRAKNQQPKQNRFVPLSASVAACAAHPLNGTIVAGTKDSSVLVISQKHQPMKIEESDM